MKKRYSILLTAFAAMLVLSSCEEEPDMAFDRVASPVLLETTPVNNSGDIQGTFYELDKSGILDQHVGIDSIPVPDLSIQVFSGATFLGSFTTDASGSIVVPGSGSLEWVGEYKGIAFLFIR